MSPTTFAHYVRAVLITTLLWPFGGHATQLNIPPFPLFLTSAGVEPNIILTLDDSGSMRRGWVPESVASDQAVIDGARFKSPSENGLYYNPDIIYNVPTRSDNPTAYKAYSTATFDFTKIYFNGFDTSKGTVDLQNAYKVVGQSEPSHNYSDCPCYNTNTCSNVLTTTNSSGTCRLVKHYPEGDTRSGLTAYYYLYYQDKPGATKPASCPATPSRSNNNCYIKVIVSLTSGPGTKDINGDGVISASDKDERENFAKWFAFYRTRAMAVMSGAMSSVSTLSNSDVRLGWQTINQCTSFGTTCQGYDSTNRENRIRTLSAAYKTNFFNWLQRFEVSGNTPMRSALKRAGEYYRTNGLNSPYAQDPYVTLGTVRSCRRDFNVLFTDGLWNTSGETFSFPSGNTNPDSSGTTTLGGSTTLTDGTVINSYSPRTPYKDVNTGLGYTNANGLADLAFYYWATDLNTGLANTLAANTIDYSGTETQQFWNPKNDPATWQHMVNYTIGLGLSASLIPNCYYRTGTGANLIPDPNNPSPGCPDWDGDTYGSDYAKLVAGTRNWPRINTSPTLNEEPDGHVYELWHAAINSRGKFYSADNPDDLVKAFKAAMNTISSAAASGGGARVSFNVVRITETNPTAFIARFNADWSGTLQALPFNVGGTLGTRPYWEAGSLIPPGNSTASPRKIFTWNGSNGAQEFTFTNGCTSGDLKTALDQITKADGTTITDNLCSQRLAWLRGYTAITGASWDSTSSAVTFTALNHSFKNGDSVVVSGITPAVYNGTYKVASVTPNSFTAVLGTNPGTYVTDENDTDRTNDDRVRFADFRERSSVLGDIMNSGVVYSQKEDFPEGDTSYGNANIAVTGGGASYKTYVAGKASRTPVVYVGANDGMLHAFNAEVCDSITTCPDTAHPNAGKELFAYIPSGVFNNLSALTDPNYTRTHKYFVDGTPTVGDAYIGGSWKTYLVGGLRAGGKSIYALDVSDPDNFDENDVKWEFTDATDLGLTFGQPQIAAVTATQWAAIFGNGYNSASEKAFLYIVDLSDGSLIAKIATNNDTSNGLSTPYPFDKDKDGIVDAIYAGDLKGNLWKFEKNSSGIWVLGNGGHPLFTTPSSISGTATQQAITTQPNAQVITIDGENKVMVYFGTGRYLEASDLTSDNVQTFYAIWDKSENVTVTRTHLLEQTIVSSAVTAGSYTARTVTNNTTSDPNNRGCYLDFPATTGDPSERIASSSLIKIFETAGLDTRVIFTTSTPPSDPCEKSGSSWLMEISATCGRLGGTAPFDINNDDQFNASDQTTIGGEANQNLSGLKLKPTTGIVSEITWVEGDATKGIAYKILPGSTGQVETIANSSNKTNPNTPKRISWEQIQ